ncbi:hydantoinase/oxoprolinase family protein [Cohaesibacter marisflavi]|uniref:hydantoinase/oxoprolinase family protein n=1 Tax=Cohaesibacter marisflavi TaxID=655353 RepID=UPI0029C70777|nr:hydantoinase/oxoprolinase family protein [Cohaesibacter marisflavi]
MSGKTVRIATDVGGTFTDLVSFEIDHATKESRIITAKSDTTPPNFEQGVLNVLKKGGVDLSSVDVMAHGTTVVINALTERKGVKVGLIATKGFRDILAIARGNRPDFFNLYYEKPEPFVPRELRLEIPGRMNYMGEETEALDLSCLQEIVETFKANGVEAIAVSLLHSYANPAHEIAVLEKLKQLCPEISAVGSHQISREWREYERTNSAVLSSYVQPVAEKYLHRLEAGVHSDGFNGQLYVMQSNCGVDTLEATAQIPITMVESGPASGFWGAAELGKLIGEKNILALDIGGTTAKCSLIENGEVTIMTDYWIERDKSSAGYPIMVPVVDLVEIGNGGGSIAWVDDYGKLNVGPQSAGASPGPAAYGRGGTDATTTDANLWLNRINRDYFCGGSVNADVAAAGAALQKLADRLGIDQDEAARGIIRIANNNMINALKLVSLNRGHDPREFTMVAFGGGGSMHAVALAKELGVKKVVVPAGASVFSAWGMMMSDLRRDYFLTALSDMNGESIPQIEQRFLSLEAEAKAKFVGEGIPETSIRFKRYGKFRYQNQEHTTEVAVGGHLTIEDLQKIVEDFHAAYEREYTYRLDAPVEMVGLHIIASAEVGKLQPNRQNPTKAPASDALKGRRHVDFATEGKHQADIYDGAKLMAGMTFSGPAIIEDPGTTIVIHPDNKVVVDSWGNFVIQI